jgi:hypothetical protein
MFASFLDDIGVKIALAFTGLICGGLMTWLLERWKRRKERLSILKGDARDTVVIHQHIVETGSVTVAGSATAARAPKSLRVRTLGQSELYRVVPNGHLARELLRRAFQVTSRDTLISMEGARGSYLLETLTNFVCDRVGNEPFEHDLYVMAPCCEPAGLAEHQPIIILIIAINDLQLFERWPLCRDTIVEHGGDGARILTLMELARRFRTEQETLANLRQAGKRTRYIETMYILDLALDKRSAAVPLKPVPWGRYEDILKQMNLE